MTRRALATAAAAVAAAGAIAACGGSNSSNNTKAAGGGSGGSTAPASSGGGGKTIIGTGSTFAAPLYDQEGSSYKSAKGITLNYGSTGSGAGVAQFIAKTVDFGDSDVFLTDSELKQAAAHGKPLDIPVAFGAVAPAFNLSGIKSLKIDGPTLADIYLGKIKNWNDPAIAKLNPGVKLPNQQITVVYRSDSSGTTGQFTEYLSAVSPQWKSQVGSGKEVKFPTGTGGKGNEGVAAAVKQTPGSIGYLELAYVVENHFPVMAIKNKSGNYESATLASTSAAASGHIRIPKDLRISTIDSPNAQAYPIASATFALIYQDPCKAGVPGGTAAAKNTVAFLKYVDSPTGQKIAKQTFYAALPPSLASKANAALSSITCNGQPIH